MNLKELLEQRNITRAHIVDDAYDKVPAYPLTAEGAQAVLDVIDEKNWKAIRKILEIVDDEEVLRAALQDVEQIARLFHRRNEVTGATANAIFQAFDIDKQGKIDQLQPLVDFLEAQGVKCELHGNEYTAQGTGEPQLFFVDLKLKEGVADTPKHEDAVAMCVKLKSVHKDCKPFVFLMSSLSGILASRRELFREGADLFQSEFESIDKKDFADVARLTRLLATYTGSMPQLAELRASMEAAEGAVAGATAEVMRHLRSLDLADYFVLFHSTTSIENVNLGSYIVEMMLEFLSHEVEGLAKVWALAKQLDELKWEQLPRARFGLSQGAARLYSANMLHSKEMLASEAAAKLGPSEGYFYTGDIYFEAKALNDALPKTALAIITPACDLVRPAELKGKSILLCEGAVELAEPSSTLTAPDGLPLVLMPHPQLPERQLIIRWNKKKLHVWRDSERARFAGAYCSFVRVGRLRPVYALQLQHAVSADLSRVGTQKPPNGLLTRCLRCIVSDGAHWHEIYSNLRNDAAAMSDYEDKTKNKKYTTYVLSDEAVHGALTNLGIWIDSQQTMRAKDKALLKKILDVDVLDAIRGFKRIRPEKAAQGKELDVTAYPLDGKLKGQEAKLIAVVRGVDAASPYARITNGSKVNSDRHVAKLVFLLDVPPVEELAPEIQETVVN